MGGVFAVTVVVKGEKTSLTSSFSSVLRSRLRGAPLPTWQGEASRPGKAIVVHRKHNPCFRLTETRITFTMEY